MEKLNITALKRRLLIEKIQLKQMLNELGVVHPDDEYDLDPIADESLDFDKAEQAEAAEALDNFHTRAEEEMTLEKRYRDVHAALLAIEAGSYGLCLECDKAIEKERMEANPAALYCIAHMENEDETSAL